MDINRITSIEAYMIETLRLNGVTDQQIFSHAKQEKTDAWNEFNTNFDFRQLTILVQEDEQKFQSVLQNGYQVKYLTFPGLQRLLKLKFDFESDRDYSVTEKGIYGLQLDEPTKAFVEQILSQNWKLVKDNNRISIEML
ncbi:hypothetical protein D3C76_129320 [compost metagenome]